jgi:hypothetical protein
VQDFGERWITLRAAYEKKRHGFHGSSRISQSPEGEGGIGSHAHSAAPHGAGSFPQPDVTSDLAARKRKADHCQGGGGRRKDSSCGVKPLRLKILPVSECAP